MFRSNPLQQLPDLPIKTFCPKPSVHPTEPQSIIIATESTGDDDTGIYQYNLESNEIKLLTKYRRSHYLENHGQFINDQHNLLYLFGGEDSCLIMYDIKAADFVEENIKYDALRQCDTYPKIVNIPSLNEIHIVGGKKHRKFNCLNQTLTDISSYDNYTKFVKLSYNPLSKQLMILGGDDNDNILTFDIENTLNQGANEWTNKDNLTMPHCVDDELNYDVLSVGNIIYVFYFEAYSENDDEYCYDIWWLDLLDNKWYKSKYECKGTIDSRGYAIKIKGSNDIHLLSFSNQLHFKVNLHDLLSKEFIKSRRNYYDPLIIGYVKQQEKDCQIHNIPLVLKKLILNYFPVIDLM